MSGKTVTLLLLGLAQVLCMVAGEESATPEATTKPTLPESLQQGTQNFQNEIAAIIQPFINDLLTACRKGFLFACFPGAIMSTVPDAISGVISNVPIIGGNPIPGLNGMMAKFQLPFALANSLFSLGKDQVSKIPSVGDALNSFMGAIPTPNGQMPSGQIPPQMPQIPQLPTPTPGNMPGALGQLLIQQLSQMMKLFQQLIQQNNPLMGFLPGGFQSLPSLSGENPTATQKSAPPTPA